MRPLQRLLFPVLVLSAAILLPARASAKGIYCSSYDAVGPKYGSMYCRTVCVYCVDQDNGNSLVGLDCYDGSCWFVN
jgi:hypothetical protein